MNLCLTPRSVKLLGTYFKNQLSGIVDNKKTFGQIQKEVFEKVVKDFGKEEDLDRTKELVLQHLIILPSVLMQHIAENPLVDNISLMQEVSALRNDIVTASKKNNHESYQSIIDGIVESLELGPVTISVPTDDGRYNAVAMVFSKTVTQEALYTKEKGYKGNVADPRIKREANIIRKVKQTNNSEGYRLKPVLLGEILKIEGVDYQYSDSDTNLLVTVIVDSKGNMVKFNEEGMPDIKGKIPVIPIRTRKSEYSYTVEEMAFDLSRKEGISINEAKDIINNRLDKHIEMLEDTKKKVSENKDVYFEIDLANSSEGFVEYNTLLPTDFADISNLSAQDIRIVNKGQGSQGPRVIIPNSNGQYADLLNKPIDTLPEEVIDALADILFNPELKRNGKVMTAQEREDLLRNYFQFRHSSVPGYTFGILKNKTGDIIQGVRMGAAVVKTKEGFKTAISKYVGVPTTNANDNIASIAESLDDVKVQAQLYKDQGITMLAKKPEINFGLVSQQKKLDDNITTVQRVLNGELITEETTRLNFIYQNSYVTVVTNDNNELRGFYPYLAYTDIAFHTDVKPVSDNENFYTSLESFNEQAKRSTDKQNQDADNWWANHPLNGPVKLMIKQGVHTKGRQYIAEFVDNMIILHAGSESTDIYHEAFHALTQGILTESERKELYDEVRSLKGSFDVIVNGKKKTVKFKDATDLDIEEYLATEFRLYAIDKSKYNKKPTTVIGRFFESVRKFLNDLFGKSTVREVRYMDKFGSKVNAIFRDLYEGSINTENFVPATNVQSHYTSFEAEKVDLTYQEVDLVMNTMNGLWYRFLTTALNSSTNPEDNAKIIDKLLELSSLNQNVEGYKEKGAELNMEIDELESSLGPKNGLGTLRLMSNPNTMALMLKYMNNVFTQFHIRYSSQTDKLSIENAEIIAKVLKHFGDYTSSIESFKNDDTTIIGIFLNNYSVFTFDKIIKDDIAWSEDNQEDNLKILFDRTGAEESIEDAADPLAVKLLSNIPAYKRNGIGDKKVNRFGTQESIPFKYVIGKLVKLVGNETDLDRIYQKMKDVATADKNEDKEIKAILNVLGEYGPNTSMIEHEQWGAVWKSITKATNNVINLTLEKKEDKEGNVTYDHSVARSLVNLRQISGQWKDNFKHESDNNDEYFITDEFTGEKYLDAEKFAQFVNDNDRDPIAIFKLIGINIPDVPGIKEMLYNGNTELEIPIRVINNIIYSFKNRVNAKFDKDKKIFDLDDLFKSFVFNTDMNERGVPGTKNQEDVSGYYLKLKELVQKVSDEQVNFMEFGATNNPQSSKTKHSSLTVVISALNNAKSYEDFVNIPGMEEYDYRINPEIAGSNWIVQRFNLHFPKDHPSHGTVNDSIKITTNVIGGSIVKYQGQEKGVASIDSDENSKFISDFYFTLSNNQEIPRSESKSTAQVVKVPTKLKNGEFRTGIAVNNTDVYSIYSEEYNNNPNRLLLYDQFHRAIEAEAIRIGKVEALLKKIKNKEAIEFDKNYLERGREFDLFDLVLTEKIKTKIKNLKLTESFTLDSILSLEEKKEIERALATYFSVRSQELLNEKGDVITLTDKILNENRISEETDEQVKERLLQVFTINNFLNNINYTVTFLGGLPNYNIEGEDFHKRIAGFISTGDIFRFDNTWYDAINSDEFNTYGFSKKYRDDIELYNGYLNTAVIKESKSNSVYLEHYAKFAGIDTKDYKGMKEADGQGWIGFDAYRLLARSSNEWSQEQEDVYNAMLAGKKIDSSIMKATFPVRKYQYYGGVTNAKEDTYGIQLKAFHKYSLAPLIPDLIEGTPLQELHEKMMREGIDYVTMESGSKLATIVKIDNGLEKAEADNIYDENRKINDDITFTINRIHIRGLKSQVKMSEGYKGYIKLPTQWQKLILLGVMDGKGVPTDYTGKKDWHSLTDKEKENSGSKNYKWVKKYEQTLRDIKEFLKNELLYDIGMKEVVTNGKSKYIGNSMELVKYIKKQIKDDELLPEEIEFLIDRKTGGLIDDISTSLNAEKIEKILITMVDKKIRAIAVNGEALVQVSGTMQEKSQFAKPTVGQLEEFGTNGLATYYLKDEKGNVVTELDKKGKSVPVISKMEVKISLQGKFKELLYLTHPDEKQILVRDENKKVDYDASLKRLNDAMRNKEWFNQHEKMFTLAGPRIPTQQQNSLEAAVVKEFLPEYAGPIIILPSEVVTKAGSDFDIDKLFLIFPNIVRFGKKIKLQEYKKSTDDINELYEDLEAYEAGLKVEHKELDLLYKDHQGIWTSSKEWGKEIKGIVRENNKHVYDRLTELKIELEDVITLASDIYNGIGKYSSYSISERAALHVNTSKRITDLSTDIDVIREALDNAVRDVLNSDERYSNLRQELETHREKLSTKKQRVEKLTQEKYDLLERISENKIGGLENRLLDLFVERITSVDNFKELVKANSTSEFTEVHENESSSYVEQADSNVTKAYDKYDRFGKKKTGKIARSTVMDYQYNLLKHQENSVGLDSLGIAAVAITYYSLFTRMGATLNGVTSENQKKYEQALKTLEDKNASPIKRQSALDFINSFNHYSLKFDHNKVETELGTSIALGFINNTKDKPIAEIIGQLINGYVDVAKDPWIFKIQGNKQNTPILLWMVMAGVPVKDIVHFTSMPMIVEYNRIKAEYNGVYANLNRESDTSPISTGTSFIIRNAREKIFNKYITPELVKELGFTPTVKDYKLISRLNNSKIDAEVIGKVKGKGSLAEFQMLLHYLEIEDMSIDMTRFQGATKYDTQKMSNLTDIQSRIESQITNKSKEGSIPNSWYVDIESTSVGISNNDQFTLDLFGRYFALRNHPVVLRMSAKVKTPDGTIRSVVQSDFKNEFMSFLFQNAFYSETTYDGYQIVQSANPLEAFSIDEENKIITYGLDALLQERESYLSLIIGGIFHTQFDLFPTIGHLIRFKTEMVKLDQETANMSTKEIGEYLWYAGNNSTHTDNPIAMKIKTAFYRSDNNVVMFDYRLGRAGMFYKILQRYPDLVDNYRLIADLRSDYNLNERKSNLWLSDVKDPQIARIYIENLKVLKNNENLDPFVLSFFNKLEAMIVMQSGMNRRSKYDMGKIVDQHLFETVLNDGTGIHRILSELDKAESYYKDNGRDMESIRYLTSFILKFIELTSNKGSWNMRVRGVNYLTEASRKERVVESKILTEGGNKVKIVTSYEGMEGIVLDVIDLYNEDGSFDMDYINELSTNDESILVLPNKIMAPEGASQDELEHVLKNKFGIKTLENRITVDKHYVKEIGGGISILSAEGLKKKYRIKDEDMANNSTVAIGQATEGNPKYKSSSKLYTEEIKSKYPEKLANTKTKFKSTDKVWIFGSGIFENAYKGYDGGKQGYERAVKNTFDTYHRPLIEKAIKAGVTLFNIGTASGIDTYAADLLKEKGYTPVIVHSRIGKYIQFHKEYEGSILYDLSKPAITLDNVGLSFIVNNELKDKINKMDESGLLEPEMLNQIRADIQSRVLNKFPSSRSREDNFFSVLANNREYIAVGNDVYSSYVEKVLLDLRKEYDNKMIEKTKRAVTPISISQEKDWKKTDNNSDNPLTC